jgi:hypothetical protein
LILGFSEKVEPDLQLNLLRANRGHGADILEKPPKMTKRAKNDTNAHNCTFLHKNDTGKT